MFKRLSRGRANDLRICRQQIITAHSWLARQTCRDDDDIGIFSLCIIICTADPDVPADYRHCLQQIQCLTLRHSLQDIHQHKVSNFSFGKPVCSGCAGHARPNNRDFIHESSGNLYAKFYLKLTGGESTFVTFSTTTFRTRNRTSLLGSPVRFFPRSNLILLRGSESPEWPPQHPCRRT